MLESKLSSFFDIYNEMKGCPKSKQGLIPNTVHVIKLLLVNPATTCTPERSFSTARRLKTWLRSTMKSKRFNSLGILNIHKDLTDQIDVIEVAK